MASTAIDGAQGHKNKHIKPVNVPAKAPLRIQISLTLPNKIQAYNIRILLDL